jgi:quercetin dioxygenase-like cupin family protein
MSQPGTGVVVHRLHSDEELIAPALLAQHGRSARTLVKDGPLRLTLVALAAGGHLSAHRSRGGPITIHVLKGDVTISVQARDHALGPGDVLVASAGVEHAVRSTAGGVFLLTVVQVDEDEHPAGRSADAS